MTIKEATIASIQVTGYSESSLLKALVDAGLTITDVYDPITDTTIRKAVDLVAIEVLRGMLAVERISEGGYTIQYSIAGIQARLNYLLGLYGKPAVGATLRDKSYLRN